MKSYIVFEIENINEWVKFVWYKVRTDIPLGNLLLHMREDFLKTVNSSVY